MLVLVPLPPIDTHATAPFRFDLSFAAIVKLRSSAMFTLKHLCYIWLNNWVDSAFASDYIFLSISCCSKHSESG